ncbi:uncharacterized protein GGS22DRAFT_172473 [Annulohypoxylon maeteangense]|uniref:uncharacterized protein n=1 Tax=Annulohypoxylon maeteangense TaxID=1927788 RepID=UPI002008A886|nr:uncharacterized protein GGS22DRAFT_172473 [Annulohypoxylon maeteangense]KAI0881566.1 hypothetical protein GGS22DRAFT_172473 [Annulohypoxylon maeteangense]
MLTLAQQSYLVALTRMQPNIIVERFAALTLRGHLTQTLSNPVPETEGRTITTQPQKRSEETGTTTKSRRRSFKYSAKPGIFGRILVDSSASDHIILFQAPTWLSLRSWELHSIKANGNWQFNLRSYSVVPRESRIVYLAMYGSPKDMQKLFDAGLASPYDRDEHGTTLLHSAHIFGNFKVVRYLVDIGLSPWEGGHIESYPADHTLTPTSDNSKEYTDFVLSDKESGQLFLFFPEVDRKTNVLHTECTCHYGTCHLGLYKALLPHQCPSHRNTSLESRIRAATLGLAYQGCRPEVIKLILEPEWSSNPQAIRYFTPNLIILSAAHRLYPPYNIASTPDVFEFTVDLIKLAPDLHITYSSQPRPQWLRSTKDTPLMVMIASSVSYYASDSNSRRIELNGPLNLWLKALKLAGIDLNTYGHREHDMFIDNDHHFIVEQNPSNVLQSRLLFYLIGFKFGPEPEDWELYWAEPTDELAGDFWDLIENPPLHIPGSWVE